MYVTRKRICCFCDGTGQDALVATDGKKLGDNEPLFFTNVLRMSRAVKPTAQDTSNAYNHGGVILQVVYYQAGVGTDHDFKGHASTPQYALQLFGDSAASKIRDAYAFISHNYAEGDEILLFGFSRGAYTARKVAGLIDRIGLLPMKEMGNFYSYCYALETGKGDPPPHPAKPVPIQVVGVWDTVGAIRTSLWQAYPGCVDRLDISDTIVPATVKVALHAVSFHENRNWFLPNLMEVPPEKKMSKEERAARKDQIVKEVWFPGEHSDVGGGWAAHELADIALIWMASEVAPYLDLDEEQLLDALRASPDKPNWGESIPHNSWTNTPGTVAFVGRIEPMTRLDSGQLKADVLLHPSMLDNPCPTREEMDEYDSGDYDSDKGNRLQAGRDKDDVDVDLVHAFGEHMITLDDMNHRFGAEWKPRLVELKPLELKARQIWHEMRPQSGHAATYESVAQEKNFARNDSAAALAKA
ncbi:hypothetical protein BKA62DRAFT_89633 [Auriculariales sp. MPI-PUGE-AT-0066]|nr:hypothetical protein BKA62DRAFT_89633 [Auriculariales sp. MPI-PUGE-AT-0066]